MLGQPMLDLLGDELRAVVTAQVLRCPMRLDSLAEPFQNILGLEGSIRPQHMTLPRVLVEDGEHTQRSTSYRGISDEVPRPDVAALVRLRRQPSRDTSANDLPFGRRHAQSNRSA